MGVSLDKVVPWGRSLEEYARMFNLTSAELSSRILDCAGGPASFNAELRRRGHAAISCDPIYEYSKPEIAKRIEETYATLVEGARQSRENFVWERIKSLDELGKIRRKAMDLFLEDFENGMAERRYVAGELPQLPFGDAQFDIAVCSHFLFTYSHLFSLVFHLDSIRELCRVAKEARIFPLVANFSTGHSPHLPEVIQRLGSEGYSCQVRVVPYEFQKGGNEMLRVSKS